ncbi:hypothetical protein OJF2_02750 [Aquisphaera giovannonii]|uniref:Uncharacterized protein n=1 Tax=Aquisphaera giovannonii TaxID=406548 RepID=A0A5B9VVR6_9BACT|nr:hypothetical protein [Aquisphaera giovannonii]QEH31810.1 hypothetical protein OJF2_02750 [Aquisphaera giovannonii]
MTEPAPAPASAPAPTPVRPRWPLATFTFFLGMLFGLAMAAGAYYAASRYLRPPEPAGPARPVFPREEFTRRVMGKSEDEVVAAVGRPDVTSEDNGARYWHFKKRTRDPVTQDEDTDVQVVIKEGKVTNINF